MKTEYVVALIMVVGGIIVALINGLIAIYAKRLDSATSGKGEFPPDKNWKRSKWIFTSLIVLIMVGLSLWRFYIARPESVPPVEATVSESESVPLIEATVSESESAPLIEATVNISATNDWQSSRTIIKGARVEVLALSGQWSPRVDSLGNHIWTDANGTGSPIYFSEIGLKAPLGSLIAKMGDGSPFVVGKNTEFVADTTEQLFFRIHDINLDDNSGYIKIRVRAWTQ